MPKKQNQQAHVTRRSTSLTVNALVAALIGVIAIPTAMTGLFQSIDDDGVNAVPVIDLRFQALSDAVRVRQLRRDYWQAVDIYKETERLNIENIGPIGDINDRKRIEYYLNPENFSYDEKGVFHASAESEPTEAIDRVTDATKEYNALAESYRDLLDGYMTAGYCPGTLRQYHLAGFYDLCHKLLDQHLDAIAPRINFGAKSLDGFHSVGNAPLRSLRKRLDSLQNSLLYEGGTSVRPQTHNLVTRPRLNYRSLRTGR